VKAFELMFRQSFEQAPERGEVSEVTIRAIVTGIRRVVYRCLREGRPAELQDHRGAAGVGVGHQRPGGTPRMELSRLVPTTPELAPAEPESMTVLSWEERPDSLRSRAELAQRERIVRAAAKVVVEQGYEALSIPAISGAAGVSNQTFYEHFANKGEAFVAAFDALAGQALREKTAEVAWIALAPLGRE
jgi:hypothetical protein